MLPIKTNFNFGPLETTGLALSPFGLAIRGRNNQYTTYNSETGELTDIQELVIDFPQNPFFTIPVTELEEGDLVQITEPNANGKLRYRFAYVIGVKKGSYTFLDPISGSEFKRKEMGNLLGINFFTKVISLIDFGGEPDGTLGGMDPLMLMAMSSAGSSNGMDPMMLMLMNKGQEGLGALDPMMLMMVMGGKNGSKIDPMMLMMMGGKNGMDKMDPMLMLMLLGGGENESLSQMLMLKTVLGDEKGGNPFAAALSPKTKASKAKKPVKKSKAKAKKPAKKAKK